MSTWNALPTEILHNIFQRLSQKDNAQCSSTCRAWKSAAQCALYEMLPAMSDEQLYDLGVTLTDSNQEDSPKNFVKRVCCDEFSDSFDWPFFDALFPFLESIYVNEYRQSFCDKVFELLKEDMFSSLKDLPLGDWRNDHLELILNRKEQLTTVDLYSLSPNNNAGELLKQLNQFPKLESLSMSWHPAYNATLYLEDLLSTHNSTLEHILIGGSNTDQIDLKSSNIDLSNIQPYLSVKSLYVRNKRLLSDGDDTYRYIMNKFPNLQSLRMDSFVAESLNTGNYTVPTLDSLSLFFVYLYNIEYDFHINAIITNQFTAKAVVNFFLNRSPNNKTMDLELRVLFKNELSALHTNDYTAHIEALKQTRWGKNRYKLMVVYNMREETITLPHMELFQQIGDKNLKYLIIGEAEKSCTTQQLKKIGSLDVIFKHFTKLEKLKLLSIKEVRFTEKTTNLEKKASSNLKSLNFKRCILTKDIFPKISVRCRNLESMFIKRCTFAIDYMDDEEGSPGTLRIVPIVMPFTRLKELYFFIRFYPYSKLLIRLKTDNEKTRYCKLFRRNEGSQVEFESLQDIYTDGDYVKCLNDNRCIVYDIYCESVTKLTVEIDYISDKYETKKVSLGENKVEEEI